MQTLTHGGDWMGYREQFGRDALDFSANVSPLGLPEGVAKAITAALATADRYPDPLCRALREKLAVAEGVPAEWLLCGNGAADLIFRLALAAKPRTALVTAPTFAEYATALGTVDCRVERHFLREENDFAVTKDLLNAVHPGTNMVFLCQPNNPTGQLASPALVRRAAARCAACGAVLAVDECFLDFLPDGDRWTAKPLLTEFPNLVIFKAFTKLYGMAGVRLGYALSADTALLDAMQHTGQPWAVSSLAQAAGLAALDETAYGVYQIKNRANLDFKCFSFRGEVHQLVASVVCILFPVDISLLFQVVHQVGQAGFVFGSTLSQCLLGNALFMPETA